MEESGHQPPIWTLQSLTAALDREGLVVHTPQIQGEASALASSPIRGVSIDTRTLKAGDLFVALEGEFHDGHNFVQAAIQKGASAVCVHKDRRHAHLSVPQLCVATSPYQALVALARFRRKQHAHATYVACTASVGKTTTRKMLCRILSTTTGRQIYQPIANYNNHIGLPVTLANVPQNAEIIVLELAMNAPGEIQWLTQLCQPDLGIIGRIGNAHRGFFPDGLAGVTRAKYELADALTPHSRLVYWYPTAPNNAQEQQLAREIFAHIRQARIAQRIPALPYVSFVSGADSRTVLFASRASAAAKSHKQSDLSVNLQSLSAGLAQNAAIAITAAEALGVPRALACAALEQYAPPEGRGALIPIHTRGNLNIVVLDDAYNASPESMTEAIATLRSVAQLQHRRPVAILGDMLELGEDSRTLHQEIIAQCSEILVLLVGELFQDAFASLVPAHPQIHLCKDASTAYALVNEHLREGDALLIKGSHGTGLHQLINHFNSETRL